MDMREDLEALVDALRPCPEGLLPRADAAQVGRARNRAAHAITLCTPEVVRPRELVVVGP